MDFNKPLTLEFSGNELALVYSGLGKLPAELSHELLNKIEAIEAETRRQEAKVPGPELKMVSASQ